MLDLLLLIIRAVQFLFAIIVVGLTGHIASIGGTASQVNFMVFVSAWTLLILIYLTLAPRFLSSLANIFAILALDALTMLFWFAGFIALAVLYHRLEDSAYVFGDGFGYFGYVRTCAAAGIKSICQQIEAAVVFGAFEW
ncbi:MAG: hypothetical protein Q9195_007514 [Heterodermia aff. obscurata]